MKEMPLYRALLAHRNLRRAPFHTPGHKCAPGALPPGLFGLDFTELPDTDSLYEASGAILQAEERAAALFGAKRTLFSAGGCSLCIQAMLRLTAPQGGRVLCARTVHRTAVNAMALLGIDPVWSLPGELCRAAEEAPNIQAVYVTSPDYYGRLADIPSLARTCKARGIPLLVDNAHGAHLKFTTPCLHPLTLGASMTACSAHKTLGVLTGGAYLNLADERYAEGAKEAMALFGSTSPSYPIMASLDFARAWLEEHAAAAYPALQARVSSLRDTAQACGIAVTGGALPCGTYDPTRLTLETQSVGVDGNRAAELFREAGVEPELSDSAHVVFIATPFNTEEDFSRLESGIQLLAREAPRSHAASKKERTPELPPLPPVRLSLREAVLAPSEAVSLEKAVGRTAAQAACPCPPGVPIVMPGEEITAEALEFLRLYGFRTLRVVKP